MSHYYFFADAEQPIWVLTGIVTRLCVSVSNFHFIIPLDGTDSRSLQIGLRKITDLTGKSVTDPLCLKTVTAENSIFLQKRRKGDVLLCGKSTHRTCGR
jgi:hypothetical protein